MKEKWAILFIFLSFFFLFWTFRSNVYTAVDGSVRCVEVYDRGAPFIHGNNHMLYPAHVYYLNKLLSLFGVKSKDAFDYFRNTTLLNVFSASTALSIVFIFFRRLTLDYCLSITGILLIGFSKSFLLNATNPNEPMFGLLLSLCAVSCLFIGLVKAEKKYMCLSGFLIAYSMATYQSMFAIYPAMILTCTLFKSQRTHNLNIRFKLFASFMLSTFVSHIFIYSASYILFLNTRSISKIIETYFHLVGTEKGVWGRFQLENIVTILFGFTQAIYDLPFYGVRATFWGEYSNSVIYKTWLMPLFIIIFLIGVIIFKMYKMIKINNRRIHAALMLASFFLFASFCPFYWDVSYSKLWLQPLTAFVLLVLYLLGRVLRNQSATAFKKIVIKGIFGCIALFTIVWNVSRVLIPNHRGEEELLQIAKMARASMSDHSVGFLGWDKLSVILNAFYNDDMEFIFVPSLATQLTHQELARFIDSKIKTKKLKNENIYFLGILDLPPVLWESFLGKKCQINYGAFDKYRRKAKPLNEYKFGNQTYILYKYY